MKADPDTLELIDLIYGALYGETEWIDFLERAKLLLPNGQALLFYHDQNRGRGGYSLGAGFDPSTLAQYDAHYSKINPWMTHATIRPLGRVMQADEMLPRSRFKATEFYNDYLRHQDVETGFGVTLRRDEGCNFLFSIICADLDDARAAEVKEVIQAITPHLRRAFTHYQRATADAVAGIADLAGKQKARGVIHVGHGMRITFVDDDALALAAASGSFSAGPFSRFQCDDDELMDFLRQTLSSWRASESAPRRRVFHLRSRDGQLPLRVSVFRPGGEGVIFFTGPECVIHVENLAEGIPAAVAIFAAMHGLSRAEQRLVAGLAQGLSIDQVAEDGRVSSATVRTQLKHVFTKSGLSRQSELVRHICLMAGSPSDEIE